MKLPQSWLRLEGAWLQLLIGVAARLGDHCNLVVWIMAIVVLNLVKIVG